MRYLTADIGSTYTKLVAIDATEKRVLGSASAFTTISTDVSIGFQNALNRLEEKLGEFKYDKLLCCSSAAGGLKMVAVGLVPSLTAKAAKLAAASAGAKVVKSYSFELTKQELAEIEEIDPDLVLLSGGTDGGNEEVIIANAKKLSTILGEFSLIVAGNKCASDKVTQILSKNKREWKVTENVMPQFNKLNIEPAKEAIQQLFIERIIEAKGLTNLAEISSGEIIPTPLAVMEACTLLSCGTKKEKGLGELVAIDLGGATTDLYSLSKGEPSKEEILFRGLPEPFAKRSVEGDLGMRYTLRSLAEELGEEWIVEHSGESSEIIESWIKECEESPDRLAEVGSREAKVEQALAKGAIKIAMERHCGYIEPVFTPFGQMFTIDGKDLSEIPLIIGVGGAIINSPTPAKILEGAIKEKSDLHYAKPIKPKMAVDSSYILASMGLLSREEPEAALEIMKKEINYKI